MGTSDIPVMILCGGKGTRIRDVSDIVPKPMLPIGDHPILWHIMRRYYGYGFRRFILCLGHMGDQIRDYFLEYNLKKQDVTVQFNGASRASDHTFHSTSNDRDLHWAVTLAETGRDNMTGSRVAQALRYVDTPYFMLTYGDGLGDIDLKALESFHDQGSQKITITGVRPAARFGKLVIEGDRVTNFSEKPQTQGEYISGGYMCVDTDLIREYLTADPGQILEVNGLPQMAEDRKMGVYKHHDFWMPMDTPTEFSYLNDLWAKGQAPWKNW